MHETQQHENECAHPHRSGAEVMEALQVIDQQNAKEKQLLENIFDLLSYEKITFNGRRFIFVRQVMLCYVINVCFRYTVETVSH